MSTTNRRFWDDALAHFRLLTNHAAEHAHHLSGQLLNIYHTCKDDPRLIWRDDVIREQITPLAILLVPLLCVWALYQVLTSKSRAERAQRIQSEEKDRKRAVLQKLLAVLTPTQSIWPETYWQLSQRWVRSKKPVYRLSALSLRDDVVGGVVELRNASTNLPDAIMGRLEVDGLRVQIESDPALRMMVHSSGLGNRKSLPIESHQSPDKDNNAQYLDRLLPANLSPFIRSLQISITIGSTAMLGFTARGRHFPRSQEDPLYHLAALPFLPRKYLKPHDAQSTKAESRTHLNYPRSALRTTIPLKTTLDNVVYLLTSGEVPLTIKSVENVSDAYTAHLDEHADHLLTNVASRTKFQQNWGTEGWREERFVAQWEAALIRAEVLARWVVVVERRV
ncbi:hypothetical protein BXZ70DRAFT_1008939 [Cristinia sonorae]|uniref:Uncharacterized protein n=1 Tax=Cristinia sonorae TaxID=1940300 RepID=A0A8K0ULG3_9AGAR|nr:hypothetical protein BXZ70DRAFT_1008939 [Cristinia sonorae]